jgi:hypothetical protein
MPENSGLNETVRESLTSSPYVSNGEMKGLLFEQIIPLFPKDKEWEEIKPRFADPWPEWALIAIGKYGGAYFSTLSPKQITAGIGSYLKGQVESVDKITLSKLLGHLAALLKWLKTDPRSEQMEGLFDSGNKTVTVYLDFFLALPKSESEACLDAFSKAYSNTVTNQGEPKKVQTNQPILWALISRWPVIEHLPNVPALHRYLNTVLPKRIVGGIKRLEAIHREHGIL